ncbi:solute carrier family 35 member F3 isoform X2 [Parasteatoda tepidariorum]|uniref:solute carrier family 35 member F3 isoform X2 n=1 Tax=Parasteatoda tepidariorum TaxID=114398 RepID=UPI001C7213CA|nr:putative thiamine transporter SLC35F3 isoform X1 [Parasteatoda tepidariorum]
MLVFKKLYKMAGLDQKPEKSDSLQSLDLQIVSIGECRSNRRNCCKSRKLPNVDNDSDSFSEAESGDAMLENRDGPRETQAYVQVTRRTCFTEHRKRLSCGLFLTSFVAVAWVGGTHLLRAMYIDYSQAKEANAHIIATAGNQSSDERTYMLYPLYNAPFFTTWVCTTLNFLFFPIYLISRFCAPPSEKTTFKKEITESIQPYHERGFSIIGFFCRCCLFTILWVLSNYMFIYSLTLLDATDVIALYTTNVAFIYLLSWVLLQEQFVGIRIVAVIMCNTGIALFAYMDGVSRALTLGGVVLAAAAAAATAVYKVLFKKMVGDVTLGQISLFFSILGLFNTLLIWPFFLVFYFTNLEIIDWQQIPWLPLMGAALFIFLANLLGNFGVIWTYEVFLTLGFLFAIPSSAAIDVYLYSVEFRGMKLAGVVLSMIGFCLVLLPENWPDYLKMLLIWRRTKYSQETVCKIESSRTSYTSRLRTQSGRVK